MLRYHLLLLSIIHFFFSAQGQSFTRVDSLRGALRPERTCYDVHYYKLQIQFDIEQHTITGSNTIYAIKKADAKRLQVDLFENMQIQNVLDADNKPLSYSREYNAVFIDFPEGIDIGRSFHFTIQYTGSPQVAKNPPWDGGFIWTKDRNNQTWIAVSCEGIGASLWWPNKDHLSDEPDSVTVSLTVPKALYAVSNGALHDVQNDDSTKTFVWHVSYPINNYNVTFYIGDYVQFQLPYKGVEADYLLKYYVLRYNLERAQKHFMQVVPMLGYYETYLGPYPFPRDGYALVESPYLGMEHQSAIAYGNDYKPGYNGIDYSMLGLDFDYIIVHESGHEYWGNSVSMADIADMWIHEGFCTYSELIYVESRYGRTTADLYAYSWQFRILNDTPVIGSYHVNHEGGTDMYYKAATMLNMLRCLVNDDNLWWDCLRGIQRDFRYKVTNTDEIIAYMNRHLGKDYTWLFNQYLRYKQPPTLEVKTSRKGEYTVVKTRWVDSAPEFCMPVFYLTEQHQLKPIQTIAGQWTETKLKINHFDVTYLDRLHYYYLMK